MFIQRGSGLLWLLILRLFDQILRICIIVKIIIATMEADDLQMRLSQTLAMHGEYRNKVEDLFRCGQGLQVSWKHYQKNIVTNPKCFFNLVESNFLTALKKQDLQTYYKLKTQIMNYVKYLFQDFPLNAKFLYEQAFLVVQNNSRINFITYILRQIGDAYRFLQKNQEQVEVYRAYITACTLLFYDICSVCTLRTSELKFITNTLSQLYYQKGLSTKVIAQCFRFMDAALQQRTITPYLYFIDNKNTDSVKVLYSNNKWPFSKGMTLFMWIKGLKKTNCTLFWVKTEDGNEIKITVNEGTVCLETTDLDSKEQSIQICSFPLNTVIAFGVQLLPINQGIFKSSSFSLNLNVGGKTFQNIGKIPKFENNEFIIQYSLLLNFIGCLYSVIITSRPELDSLPELMKFGHYGICRQSLVWEFVEKKCLKLESILCVFNPQRYFEGLLLNFVFEKNHACFEGRISTVKYHKYDDKIVDIYLPFLYLMTLIEEKNDEWRDLFDLIMQYILTIIGKEHIETKSVLLLLFFLEMNDYQISQSTLNLLYESSKEHDNFYMDIVVKYMDAHVLIGKGLTLKEEVEPFEDPVQKMTLMFHIQTVWFQTWNSLQGFEGWWSPFFFKAQKDHPFDSKDFLYDQNREKRVEWQVRNFVAKDYCKCLVQPKFILPEYGKLDRFQSQYIKKECFVQQFKMCLFKKKTGELLSCQKVSSSSFDKLKNRFLGKDKSQSPVKKKQQTEFKEFSSPCIYIDILTIIEGVVHLTKDGFLMFSSKHNTKRFDHMCVKGFKNQYFEYMNLALEDIRKIYKKRFNATNNALFIKVKDGKEYMLHFYLKNADALLNLISGSVKIKKDAFGNYLNAHKPIQWIDKKISNYEYLQWLNEISGRSYIDMTQYPVLPWALVSNSSKLDYQDKESYRDLSKNMGLQGDNDRIRYFLEKYNSQNDQELFSQYHFGTHYSSSAIIFNFLIRIRPYSIGALTLQSGKFDVADRIFYSFHGSWKNAISSPTDIRELIPELYTLPEMLINQNNYEYGTTQEKVVVDNVILPLWACGNPYSFVAELRKSLQSSYVSSHLHQWIDLIYGFKQRGKDAIENMNIFYPLTYQNCIDLDKVTDPADLESFETQIAHFGQNPAQIIGNNPHPSRMTTKAKWQDKLVADGKELLIRKCFLNKGTNIVEEKFIFQSIFEARNSILGVKFIGDDFFFVLRKHEYYLFQILNEKANFLSKELQVQFELESIRVSLNYKELTTFAPLIEINHQIIMIGGFYNGYVQLIFLKQPKYNRSFKFPTTTITALAYHKGYHILYLGDCDGYVKVYHVTVSAKHVDFEYFKTVKAHDSKINDMIVNYNANLVSICSQDGSFSLYNAYSFEILRKIRHPNNSPIHLAHITTSPLYAVVFYSKDNSTIYVYSINGQMLDSITEKTGFIYNMNVVRGTDSTQSLVYLNAQRELFIWELPYLKLKRKVKVKKDDSRISCFQICQNSKMAVAGTQEGGLQIISNPESY